jgi:hypothetical protein
MKIASFIFLLALLAPTSLAAFGSSKYPTGYPVGSPSTFHTAAPTFAYTVTVVATTSDFDDGSTDASIKDDVNIAFQIGGIYESDQEFLKLGFNGKLDLGESVTKTFGLSAWPTRLKLIHQGGDWGWGIFKITLTNDNTGDG